MCSCVISVLPVGSSSGSYCFPKKQKKRKEVAVNSQTAKRREH